MELKNPSRSLMNLTKRIADATSNVDNKQDKVDDIKSRIHKIKRFASNKRIRKDTVNKEIDDLHGVIMEILETDKNIDRKQDYLITREDNELLSLMQIRERIGELNVRLIESEKRLTSAIRMVMEQLRDMGIEKENNVTKSNPNKDELKIIDKQIKKLEEMYSNLDKEGSHNKGILEEIKNRIEYSKERLAQLKA